MYTLRMLGGISLTDEAGAEVDALLRQTKHVALLAYLTSPRPGTWHKRDSVLGTFWAEHDQGRSRSAFRSALYTLRQHLPENAIRARGDNDLSVDPQLVATDVASMEDFLEHGEFAHALACYKGEFLPGIYVADAEGFDHWLEGERRRTRSLASRAAGELSKQLEARGDLQGAISAARRNYDIDRSDEGAARRLIALLDASGDRAQAFAVYEEFRNHVYDAFGVRPSAETVALLDAIRTRHEPGPVPDAAPIVRAAAPAPPLPPTKRRRKSGGLALAAIPVAVAALAWTVWSREQPVPGAAAKPGSGAKTLVILPVVNETSDSTLDYLSSGIGDELARQLDIGSFNIRSASHSNWPESIRGDIRRIASTYKASFLVRAKFKRLGDSLQLSASVIDAATMKEEPVVKNPAFLRATMPDAANVVAAQVAGSIFQRELPAEDSTDGVDPLSADETAKGFYDLLSKVSVSKGEDRVSSARSHFLKARDIDPRNARAWAGLSSVIASDIVSDRTPFEQGYQPAHAAAEKALKLDPKQGGALANLAILEALRYNKLSLGEKYIREAEAADPTDPEIYLVKAALYRNAHMWDKSRDAIRFAQYLDPWTTWYIDREAIVEFCAGNPQKALALYDNGRALDPSDGLIQGGITRALAMLHRYDEAIDSWRIDARAQGDSALLKMLSTARGKDGYWNVKHALGRKRLAKLADTRGRISPLTRMQASFAAGDSAAGFAALDELIDRGILAKYRLPCMQDNDEFRDTQRFKDAVARAGRLMN